MRGFLPGLLVLVLLTACTVSPLEADDEDAVPEVKFRMEDSEGTVTQTFSRDETVRFVFEVHNPAAHPASLRFTFPPHRVDVRPAGGNAVVWQAHHGRMFPQVMKRETVPAGESLEFAVEWDFRQAQAPQHPVSAGVYDVLPEFNAFIGEAQVADNLETTQLTLQE